MAAGECFICHGTSAVRVTVVLESKVFEEKELCEECSTDFKEEDDWVEIHESPVLTRSGDIVWEE